MSGILRAGDTGIIKSTDWFYRGKILSATTYVSCLSSVTYCVALGKLVNLSLRFPTCKSEHPKCLRAVVVIK